MSKRIIADAGKWKKLFKPANLPSWHGVQRTSGEHQRTPVRLPLLSQLGSASTPVRNSQIASRPGAPLEVRLHYRV